MAGITYNDFNQNSAMAGLNTYTVIVPNAGPYVIRGKLLLPTIVGGAGPSSCVTTVNVNGSPVYTGNAGAEGFMTTTNCAAGDTITIVTTSAAAADQPLNAIKMSIAISQGVS